MFQWHFVLFYGLFTVIIGLSCAQVAYVEDADIDKQKSNLEVSDPTRPQQLIRQIKLASNK